MVSAIGGTPGSAAMQQMMAAMQKKMKSADTDGKEGLSKEELASIDAGDDKGGSHMISELSKNFEKIDKNGDGQLNDEEIKASKPEKPMGPPPGMMMENSSSSSKASGSSSQTYDELDTNEDGEVSIQERLAGEEAEASKTGSSSESSKSKGNSGLSSYNSKLLSSYQNNSSESTSSYDFAA